MSISKTNYYSDFDEIFADLFGTPSSSFNAGGTIDRHPTKWNKTEKGYKCTCRSVGIDEKDIKVEVVKNGIIVSGKTECEGETYTTKCEIPISKDILDALEKIEYKTVNGLTYIYLTVKIVAKSNISVIKIK